ncbi:hypothetical protein J5839_01495 [Methanosarcinaceae archaeon]|nr:hypothetical protein [Methanosarcinaceae archaeon]
MTTLITKTVSKVVMIFCLIYSIYLLLNGGNYPGGGFIGGVLLVCGVSIVYLAYGSDEINRLIKPQWLNWVGFGLLFASLTALFPLFAGHHYFRSSFADFEIDLFGVHIGTVEFVSSMMFDLGVYFTVVGSLLFIITQIASHKVATAGKEHEDTHTECIDGSCRIRRSEIDFPDEGPKLFKVETETPGISGKSLIMKSKETLRERSGKSFISKWRSGEDTGKDTGRDTGKEKSGRSEAGISGKSGTERSASGISEKSGTDKSGDHKKSGPAEDRS